MCEVLKAGFSGFLFPSVNHQKTYFCKIYVCLQFWQSWDLLHENLFWHENPKDFTVALNSCPHNKNLHPPALFPTVCRLLWVLVFLWLHVEPRALCMHSNAHRWATLETLKSLWIIHTVSQTLCQVSMFVTFSYHSPERKIKSEITQVTWFESSLSMLLPQG